MKKCRQAELALEVNARTDSDAVHEMIRQTLKVE